MKCTTCKHMDGNTCREDINRQNSNCCQHYFWFGWPYILIAVVVGIVGYFVFLTPR